MKTSRGFSLVELMVAITIGLVITAGVISIFVGTRSQSQSTQGLASVTDGGRFALSFIESSVRSAGFMACNTAAQGQMSLLSAAPSPLMYNFTEGLGGFEAAGTGPGGSFAVAALPLTPDATAADWNSGTDPSNYIAGADPAMLAPAVLVKGNDILVTRATLRNTQSAYVTNIVDGASNFTINLPNGLAVNQIAVLSDCSKSSVFQISGMAPAAGPNPVISLTVGGAPGNSVANFSPYSYPVGSQMTAVDTVVYFIGIGADGDGALFSYDLYNGAGVLTGAFNANELVPDIEAMQVLYGIQTAQPQTVGQYVTADQVSNFNAVMSVKVALLAASLPGAAKKPTTAATFDLLGTSITAPIDTRTRQVFETTIAVRNALN